MNDPGKILIIDDEADIREVLASILKYDDHQVVEAEDGEQALALLEQDEFSLILCDITMPNLGGLDFFMRMKARGVRAPLVFITGSGDEAHLFTALRLGALDLIRKPFDNSEVSEVVHRGLEVSRRQNQIWQELRSIDAPTRLRVEKNDKMISLLRIQNHQRRSR